MSKLGIYILFPIYLLNVYLRSLQNEYLTFFMQKTDLGWFADPKKLLDYFKRFGDILDAYYYIGEEAPPDARQLDFLDALHMGYSLVT